MKDLENIVGDIYKVVDSGADIDKEDMDYFLNTMRDELTSFLSKTSDIDCAECLPIGSP